MTNDRPIHILNYQWEASIHFNCPIIGQYTVIFFRHYEKLHMHHTCIPGGTLVLPDLVESRCIVGVYGPHKLGQSLKYFLQ